MIKELIKDSLLENDPTGYCYEQLIKFCFAEKDKNKQLLAVEEAKSESIADYISELELGNYGHKVDWHSMKRMLPRFANDISSIGMWEDGDTWFFGNSTPSEECAESQKIEFKRYQKSSRRGGLKGVEKGFYWFVKNEINNKYKINEKRFTSNDFVRLGLVDHDNNLLTKFTTLVIEDFKKSGFLIDDVRLISLIVGSYECEKLNLFNNLIDLYGDIGRNENLLLRELLIGGSREHVKMAKWLIPKLESMKFRSPSEDGIGDLVTAYDFVSTGNWYDKDLFDQLKEAEEKINLKNILSAGSNVILKKSL